MKTKLKFIIPTLIIIIIMTIFITQKEGFHEDEMFSYGSSNYKYDNVFRPYGKRDNVNQFLVNNIFDKHFFKNLKHYFVDNIPETSNILNEISKNETPIWKEREEAQKYLSIQKEDILNYPMVYYNQARDVHPPLFYFLVHTISIFFYNNFSKYIIFIINLAFMIATCFVIKKIMEIINRSHLTFSAIILYGLSMGAISTVMFQRMYMMLTFFVLSFILINLKIIRNEYKINKKMWLQLGTITILGFLTQYYFCIIAAIVAIIIFINILKNKDKNQIQKYIFNYIKIALIGVILFPASIYHIFFSYRGMGSLGEKINYSEKILQYIKSLEFAFSIPAIIMILSILTLAIIAIYKISKKENKHISEILMLTVPEILFTLIIAKIAPALSYPTTIRYILCILPMFTIAFLLLCDMIIKNKKCSTVILSLLAIFISLHGLLTNKPAFLYKGYDNYLQIAEQNKNDYFVFVGESVFNHIQSMPEFATYKASLILNENELNYLENNEELCNSNEFILSIKTYLGNEQLLTQVLEKTGYTQYEMLLDGNCDTECAVYKVKK